MYNTQTLTKRGNKTKYVKYTLTPWIMRKYGLGHAIRSDTLTQRRASNARMYKRLLGMVTTYPKFGAKFTYLGAHKVFL